MAFPLCNITLYPLFHGHLKKSPINIFIGQGKGRKIPCCCCLLKFLVCNFSWKLKRLTYIWILSVTEENFLYMRSLNVDFIVSVMPLISGRSYLVVRKTGLKHFFQRMKTFCIKIYYLLCGDLIFLVVFVC